MTISDEAAEAAATALHAHYAYENEGVEDYPSDEYICCARAALEAAAPYIRAGALEDAADEIDAQRDAANPDRKPGEGWSVIDHRAGRFLGKTVAARLLRARAAAERGGE